MNEMNYSSIKQLDKIHWGFVFPF